MTSNPHPAAKKVTDKAAKQNNKGSKPTPEQKQLMAMFDLSLLMARFCEEYSIDGAHGPAYRRAGFKGSKQAATLGAKRLLITDNVQKALEYLTKNPTRHVTKTKQEVQALLWDLATDKGSNTGPGRVAAAIAYGKSEGYFPDEKFQVKSTVTMTSPLLTKLLVSEVGQRLIEQFEQQALQEDSRKPEEPPLALPAPEDTPPSTSTNGIQEDNPTE